MPLKPYACGNCGFWQKYFATPPDCPVCTDTRNDLPEDGWDFWDEGRVAAHLTGSWRDLGRGLIAFRTAPRFGLDGIGWLLLHEDGNVAFEAAPYYTAPMRDEIRRLGGIRYLSGSHCHGYGALWQLQDVFEPDFLAIQREDLRMTKAMRVNYPYDDVLELRPGVTLHHVGGHYEGQSVLHDATRGILFCGDAFKVDQDAAGNNLAVSSHKAFHKDIPLTRREVEKYRDVIGALRFDTICTPFEYAPGITTEMAVRALDAQVVPVPEVRRVPMATLRADAAGATGGAAAGAVGAGTATGATEAGATEMGL
ncbi:MBL fold metallo-hydrolase [Roseomonas elaeocarpi]|uniref:Metallo-beta-lactamase domain-containing protein n=1 Tax=Roseomonas elaeocarpi TaxID=907779 RepID=A0ABV6JUI3_9PROT